MRAWARKKNIGFYGKTFSMKQITAFFGMFAVVALFAGGGATRLQAEGLDYSVWGGGRSLPRGAAIQGTLGYGYAIWGDSKSVDPIGYGYVRPMASLTTSFITHRAIAAVEIFPVPIFGVGVGHFWGSRGADTDTIDCVSNICRGSISGTFVDARLVLGVGSVFLKATGSCQSVAAQNQLSDFSDEWSTLVGTAGGDRLVQGELIVGVKIAPALSVGTSIGGARMVQKGNNSSRQALFTKITDGDWAYALSVGAFRSSHHPNGGLSLGFSVLWTGVAALGY